METIKTLWAQEMKAFLLQENSQQIIDNLNVIPKGDVLLNTYIELRISIYLVREDLKNISIPTNLHKYAKLLGQRKKLEEARDQMERDMLRSPTTLQLVLGYPGRFTFDKYQTVLEIIRDFISGRQAHSKKPVNIAKTKRYIWRTAGDKKVRPEHAKREGLIFRYDLPPKGGNPGESYGCRCWAEPISDDWEHGLGKIFKK